MPRVFQSLVIVDLLIQGHDPNNDESNLVFTFLKMVDKIQPKWFVMENVPGLANLNNGKFLHLILKDLSTLDIRI